MAEEFGATRWPQPQAAYVHIPFCRHHCGYCNFSVLAGHDDRIEDFLTALEIELRSLGTARQVETLFIGGGTPTHLPLAALERLLRLLSTWFPLSQDGEYTCEANPRDISREKIEILRVHGVNRLSLGVQAFNQRHLATLERDHDAETVTAAVEMAHAEIQNLSIDLIFGVPGQTLAQWQSDLQRSLTLPIHHLSTYGLTFEKGTRFWNQQQRGALVEVGEETELAMYEMAQKLASEAQWRHYEISNFSKPGFECRHNKAYWEGRGWFAVGPGAARFVEGCREVNHRSPMTYIHRLLRHESPTAESEAISPETWARERLAFGLRMIDGVSLDVISSETGVDLMKLLAEQLSQLESLGMISIDGGRIRLSARGLVVSDSVVSRLL